MKNALKKYGLNNNEITVFLNLVNLGGAYAKDLIEKTKFHKNIIYDNLYKLKEKGLVSEIIINKKKYFQCETPDAIEQYIQNKKTELNKHEQEINKLKTQILETKKLPTKTITRMYTGVQGVKQIFNLELDIGEDYLVIGAPIESVKMLGEHYWKNFVAKQKEKNMKGKLIFNESLRKFSENIKDELNEIRFIKHVSEPLTEICIFKNYVAIVLWSEEPIATLIESEQIANSHRDYFNILWREAKN